MAKRKPSEALDAILASGKAINVADLAEHLIDAIGGTQEFARLYVDELKAARGIAKSKMLEGVMRIVNQASQGQKTGDPSDMSDAELRAELLRFLEANGLNEEASNAPPQTAS